MEKGKCVWNKAIVWKKASVCGKDESESISNQLINALLQQLHML